MPPRLPRYEILAELGQGGMSVVYRARDTQLPREVAVKVLHEFMARDPDARLRFHREAVAVAKLHHPGIVEIFDYSGPDAPDAFIVTELIEGSTLRELLDASGPLGLPELGALVTAALCEALAHAHDAGVVHRDLKPENVMVTRTGELKLMDFGIAQIADGPRVTLTGTLLGSPAHMAPEVIDGARPDARSDLFSLGTMLYWLATGALPFEASNPSALFRRILEGEYPDPQQVEPRMGNGLARVIRRALERDPEARYPEARALGAALRAELELVGLTPVETESRALLADPRGYLERVRAPVVARLTAAGKEALAAGNVARAMDRLSRVLAIVPEDAEARALVARLGRRETRARRARQAAFAAVSLVLAGGMAWGVREWSGSGEAWGGGPAVPTSSGPPVPSSSPSSLAFEDPTVTTTARTALPPLASADAGASATIPRGGPTPSPAGRELAVARSSPSASPSLVAARVGGAEAGASDRERDAGATAASPAPSVATAPSDAGAASSPSARPAVVAGELRLRIGNSFANVYVNGQLTRSDFFGGTLRLPVGTHTIEVRKPGFGGFRPKQIEVDAEGHVSERRGDTVQRIGGELLYAVPRQGQVDLPVDWVPESGTASAP